MGSCKQLCGCLQIKFVQWSNIVIVPLVCTLFGIETATNVLAWLKQPKPQLLQCVLGGPFNKHLHGIWKYELTMIELKMCTKL